MLVNGKYEQQHCEVSSACNEEPEVEFVQAVTAGGSVNFLPAV